MQTEQEELMNREDVTITFTLKNNKWHLQVSQGKYAYAAAAQSLEDAENKAYEYLNKLSNSGTVHTIYNPGKPVQKPSVTWEEEGKAMGYVSVDKTLSDTVD